MIKLKHCIIVWALVGIGFLAPVSQKIADSDLWWHIATGRYITQTHSIPSHDLYSFTAPAKEWITHEWVSELVFYGVHQQCGLAGIIVLRAALLFLLTLGLFLLIYRRTGNSVISAGISALLVLAGCSLWSERPQLFSYIFLVLILLIVDRWRRGGSLWWVVPIFPLWVNTHGAWISGFGALTIVLAGELAISVRSGKRQNTLGILLVYCVCGMTLFANPIGIKLITYPFQYFGSSHHTNYISEWRSPSLWEREMWPYWIVLVGFLSLVAVSRTKARASEWILAFGSCIASVYSIRHIPVFAILASPLIAEQVKGLLERCNKQSDTGNESWVLNWMMLLALLAFLSVKVAGVCTAPVNANIRENKFPIRAVDLLASRERIGSGRLMVAYNWGGYAIFKLYPKYRVSIDGRADVYGESMMQQNNRLELTKGRWRADLEQLNPDVILWPRWLPLAKKLRSMSGWRMIYEDRMSVIYVKRNLSVSHKGAVKEQTEGADRRSQSVLR